MGGYRPRLNHKQKKIKQKHSNLATTVVCPGCTDRSTLKNPSFLNKKKCIECFLSSLSRSYIESGSAKFSYPPPKYWHISLDPIGEGNLTMGRQQLVNPDSSSAWLYRLHISLAKPPWVEVRSSHVISIVQFFFKFDLGPLSKKHTSGEGFQLSKAWCQAEKRPIQLGSDLEKVSYRTARLIKLKSLKFSIEHIHVENCIGNGIYHKKASCLFTVIKV